ncbi:60S ribosomal protein L18 [Dimargaris cristalligena]|uniref:Ribosomal protein L18e/L15P n=1 Tax=Dimargaris cristalligena TaxID=215637 RepID=A0A4V1J4Y2_9FUNG|nr:60S ribosomal protein L18 [Dimargaris cristalligena]RKP37149.1 ribosomal protein L18e/L15P [Dimargaris cristalligena]|eukprot:RKP37149.1 ribosomal protein L18e/L15P [Dimargaris cristalligena]
MGIDIKKHHVKTAGRKVARTDNPYVQMLVKLYTFLTRRTSSNFNKQVLRRLMLSNTNRPTLSVSRLSVLLKPYGGAAECGKIAVVVGTVSNDTRLFACPKVTVCALKVTDAARERILAAGGEIITFDQLATRAPTGTNCLLLQGHRKAREAVKHFGAAGVPGGHAKPYIRSKGRKFERARGRRASRGFKN